MTWINTEIKSRWTTYLNIKDYKITKTLEENTEHLNVDKDFFNKTQKVLTIKFLNNKMNYNKIRISVHWKIPLADREVTQGTREDIYNTYIQQRAIKK